jgi:hypothetical protein
MVVGKIEALAEAITAYTGYREPTSNLYKIRNPGALKAFSMKDMRDSENLRIFQSFTGGFHALINDLERKCSGESYCGLKTTSTLRDLIAVYQHPATITGYIVKFLKNALQDDAITDTTHIGWFLE